MMDRKEFIKTCGFACASLVGLSAVLSSCTSPKYIQSREENHTLRILKTDFFKENDPAKKARRFVIVKTEALAHPIVVYNDFGSGYIALLLQCTHQSMELNVSGDLISCSAHGSEFNNKGEVVQGPAEQTLKRYRVTHDTETLVIHLI